MNLFTTYGLESPLKLYTQLKRKNSDTEMLMEGIMFAIEDIHEANRIKLFDLCTKLNVKEFAMMDGEVICFESYEGSPAAWKMADVLSGATHSSYDGFNGFAAGCGNGNQYQCSDTWAFLGKDFTNKAYNVSTREEIDIEPFKKAFVCHRGSNPPRRAFPWNS